MNKALITAPRELDDAETIAVPFLFVPDGMTPDPQWLADHPDHIRLPAIFVPDPGETDTRHTRAQADAGSMLRLASMENYDAPPPPPPPVPLERKAGSDKHRLVIYVGGFDDGSGGPVLKYYKELLDDVSHDSVYASHADQTAIERLINETPTDTQIAVVGHSYGGDTAAKAVAAAKRKVDLLVTVDPVSRFRPDFVAVKANTSEWVDIYANPTKEDRDGSDRVAAMGSQWGEAVRTLATTFIETGFNHRHFAKMIENPTIPESSVEYKIDGGRHK